MRRRDHGLVGHLLRRAAVRHRRSDLRLSRVIKPLAGSHLRPCRDVSHRAVLLECYYRGAPVAEAARHLGVPEGTVKSRTHYALRALRLALEEMGVGA